ncbi:MAG: hypothetical protein EXR69_06140 [Myxococcales bacterium]|nr:hypothetical protein [Myxococcales bacterium]
MSRWMINASGHQFSAATIDELKKLAKDGKFSGGDILQPPGAAEWIYALELPELKTVLREEYAEPDAASGMGTVTRWALAGVLAMAAAGAWVYAYGLSQDMPDPDDLELIGGKSGLKYTEVLVTGDPAGVFASEGGGAQAGTLPKNSRADLLGKRGDWYRVRAGATEGYVRITDVIPAYFFADGPTQDKYKPLYYPDQFVTVVNSSWSLVPGNGNKNVTNFIFMLGNSSTFGMTDVRLKATIKDKDGKELEVKEVPVEGLIKPNSSTMIGTLAPDPKDRASVQRVLTEAMFTEMMAVDPKVVDRWVEGVDIKLDSVGFDGATITVAEVRAVPPEEMPALSGG